MLLEAAIERAENRSARRVVGAVGARNATGRILLERAGFRAHGRRRRGLPAERSRPSARRVRGPPDLAVRAGTPADLDATMRLYRECFPDGPFPRAPGSPASSRVRSTSARRAATARAIVNIDAADRWIYHLGVTASERDQGIGAYVLSEALAAYWSTHPGETLGLSVAADNLPALRLYRRQGFAPCSSSEAFELHALVLLGIDQGTTGTTCLVVDETLRTRGRGYREVAQHFPGRGGSSRIRTSSGSRCSWRRATRSKRRDRGRRPRGDRDHEPARDDDRLGPDHRRAGPPRDRLAGPAHGRALQGAARRPHPRPDGPRPRSLLLGDEARVDPREAAGSATWPSGRWIRGSSGS